VKIKNSIKHNKISNKKNRKDKQQKFEEKQQKHQKKMNYQETNKKVSSKKSIIFRWKISRIENRTS